MRSQKGFCVGGAGRFASRREMTFKPLTMGVLAERSMAKGLVLCASIASARASLPLSVWSF